MKQIAITGGKGGTGKSTFAIFLAANLIKKGKKVILCDCDIECPNDWILLRKKLKKPLKSVFREFPKIDKRKCRKCGRCVSICRFNAIYQLPNSYPEILKDLCSSCGACWNFCPFDAISSKKEKIGDIFLNKVKKNLYLVTGRVKPKIEETSPVVRETKEFAFELAKKIKADFILFDSGPGTHCPVITALLDCDLVYVVTEPTPLGAWDLNLILTLIKKLKLPFKIVLNQANLGERKELKKILKKFRANLFLEIPFSFEILKAYSKGELLNLKWEKILKDWKKKL